MKTADLGDKPYSILGTLPILHLENSSQWGWILPRFCINQIQPTEREIWPTKSVFVQSKSIFLKMVVSLMFRAETPKTKTWRVPMLLVCCRLLNSFPASPNMIITHWLCWTTRTPKKRISTNMYTSTYIYIYIFCAYTICRDTRRK